MRLDLVKNSLKATNGSADSLLITCASYEERSTLSSRLLSRKFHTETAVVFGATEFRDIGRTPQYFQTIIDAVRPHCRQEPEPILFKLSNPLDVVRKLQLFLKKLNTQQTFRYVTIDITTFPRQALLLLIHYVDKHPHRGVIRLLYGEPKRYATEARKKEDRWLTRGVTSVKSVPQFGGVQFPRRAKLLAVILGHEGERTHITVRRHQPDKLILIPQGHQQHHKGLREIAERENEQIISIYGQESFWKSGLPSRGVVEAERVIKKIYGQHRYTHNMFLAPNGTKLQLIGAYLACRRLPEIQITYAVPAIYNWQKYSTGITRLCQMILTPPQAEE